MLKWKLDAATQRAWSDLFALVPFLFSVTLGRN